MRGLLVLVAGFGFIVVSWVRVAQGDGAGIYPFLGIPLCVLGGVMIRKDT